MATSRDYVQSILSGLARIQKLPDEVLDLSTYPPDTPYGDDDALVTDNMEHEQYYGGPGDIRRRLADIDDRIDDLLTAIDNPEEA